jgi:DNA invertase Pin-like site-specific DNA recombinase
MTVVRRGRSSCFPTEDLFVYVYALIHDLMLVGAIAVPARPGPAPACRRVMWVRLRFGQAGEQQRMCCDSRCGPGQEAPEGVRAVAGQFHPVGDLAEGGLDPVAPFGDDFQQARWHRGTLLLARRMKRLGRDGAELTAIADHLAAHGLALEMLAGPLAGIYDPSGHGRILFAFFAALAETERDSIREGTIEGLDAAARQGRHGGRPPVITDDMLHTVLRCQAAGEKVEAIQPDLVIPTGKRRGQSPSVASIYRALAAQARAQSYPDAIDQAHTEFAALPTDSR